MAKRALDRAGEIGRSILTAYRDTLWAPFVKGIRRYQMIREGDRIAVCISGGKDSMLLAKMMQLLQKHYDVPFEVTFLVMDPGYNKENRAQIEENLKTLQIPAVIFESDVFEVANVQEHNPCYLCARMRRGCLYKKAQELGCNKIALGHHFDDVIGTTVMSMFWSAKLEAMMPMVHARNFDDMTLIRPMYLVHEEDIIAWRDENALRFIQCACRFTGRAETDEHASKRLETKLLLKRLRENNPDIEKNIFNSIHNVDMDTFPAWKKNGESHNFMEHFYDPDQNG